MKNFVLIGAGGYIAPRHMKAIKDTGNNLLAALDKHDSVGILDSYFPKADFFTEFERFDRHCEKLRRNGSPIDYVTVCSPNYLHDAHARFGLRIGADVICEKPVVLNPWNVEALMEIEKETAKKIFTIQQLRLHPAILELKRKIAGDTSSKKYTVQLKYITARGNWYHSSWKGDIHKSGGIATNIGIHFFDLLLWIFGDVQQSNVTQYSATAAAGTLALARADVNWELSIDEKQLPASIRDQGKKKWRSLEVDGKEIPLNDGFDELHTEAYKEILDNKGIGLVEAGKAIALAHQIRNINIR